MHERFRVRLPPIRPPKAAAAEWGDLEKLRHLEVLTVSAHPKRNWGTVVAAIAGSPDSVDEDE